MRIDQIKIHVPQRFPLLLIDRILDVVPGQRARALKNVTANEPCYEGVPDRAPLSAYAYPTSLLIESMSQTAGVLLRSLWGQEGAADEHVIMFGSIRGFRLLAPVYPGDTLEHEVQVLRAIGNTAILRGVSHVQGTRVCEADEIVTITKGRDFR